MFIDVSHIFFKQEIWIDVTYPDIFCHMYSGTYPNISKHITFSNIYSGGEDECLTQNLES